MGEKLEKEIELLKVINVILISAIAFMALLITPYLAPQHSNTIEGKLEYMSDISDPNNISKGVWIKITLKNPEKVTIEHIHLGLYISREIHGQFNFNENFTAKFQNYTAEFYDVDKDGYVSSGDVFHIYGDMLENVKVWFSITAYNGQFEVET